MPTTSYNYNGAGTRIWKSNTNGSRTYKRDGAGITAPVLSDSVSTMVPGISERHGGVNKTLATDRLGSTKALIASGAITDTSEFDAFGVAVSRTGTTNTQKGFVGAAGYQEDAESGYKLLGHRYYDPETGRFLSRDPAQHGKNWYRYCENNPLSYKDPTGLKERNLTNDEKDMMYAAVDLIAQSDPKQAKLLRDMVRTDKFKVDEDLAESVRAEYRGGRIVFNKNVFVPPAEN